MEKNIEKVFVTGGAGFIGSEFVRQALQRSYEVLNFDKLSYAGNLSNIEEFNKYDSYTFVKGDIVDEDFLFKILDDFSPDAIVHLAAESHVDNSILRPKEFIETNVIGTFNLLEYVRSVTHHKEKWPRLIHVSTDEVYGTLNEEGSFTEETRYDPSSPYSASKASSDHLVRAWHRTYNIDAIITNCSNNFGPKQHPEKLIPKTIINAINGDTIPIFGGGTQIRDWLHVSDHVSALLDIIEMGKSGESYNIGARNEWKNYELATALCKLVDEKLERNNFACNLIKFIDDRPGHDYRYAIEPAKIEKKLNWSPAISFSRGLENTVDWYLQNKQWWQPQIKNSRK